MDTLSSDCGLHEVDALDTLSVGYCSRAQSEVFHLVLRVLPSSLLQVALFRILGLSLNDIVVSKGKFTDFGPP